MGKTLPSSAEQAQNMEVATLRQETNKELDALVAQLQAGQAEQVQHAEVTMLRQESIILRSRNQELENLVSQLKLKADVAVASSQPGIAARDELGAARIAQLEVELTQRDG